MQSIKTNTIKAFALALLTLILLVLSPLETQASDIKNKKSSFFKDVERAYLYVDYVSFLDEEDVPEEMRKHSIEKLMLDIYKMRFSSEKCAILFPVYKNPYGCNGQPVLMVSNSESHKLMTRRGASFANDQELNDPSTLIVILRIKIIDNSLFPYDPPLKEPLLVYQIIQDRPGNENISVARKVKDPGVVPLNQNLKIYKGEGDPKDYFAFGILGSVMY